MLKLWRSGAESFWVGNTLSAARMHLRDDLRTVRREARSIFK
jgi:hypothetical protein